ncbi:MAG: class II aldolase/adducin family protein [Salinivirgaceae bacterium]
MPKKTKKQIAQFMRRLYKQGLTTTSGGNISVRHKDTVYITASQTDKGKMKAKDVGTVDLSGNNLSPALPLSMETQMHLAIYTTRPDVRAIVHAHPVAATTLSASPNLIDTGLNGEARALLGKPAFAPYQLMGSKALAEEAAKAAAESNIIILQHHGIVALGCNLLKAFDRLELTEMAARGTIIRKTMGIDAHLTADQLKELDDLML